MKLVRILLTILVVLIVAAGAILVIIPSDVTVTRSKTIKAPVEIVFQQVNTLKNWENWSPWFGIDPNMELSYEGNESGAGSAYSWKSEHENVGNGRLAIVESTPNESIKTEIEFEGMGTSDGAWAFKSGESETEVSWSMTMDAGMNPIGRIFNLMMDNFVGPDFEKGLARLDEAAMAAAKEIEEEEAAMVIEAMETGAETVE